MKKFLFVIVVFVSFFVNTNTFAQNDEQKWTLSTNVGSSLLWGDGASSDFPLNRWFSPESGLTLGLRINRNLSQTFSLYADIQKGYMYGERKKWSSDLHPIVTSNIDYFDYHVGVGIDFTSMFGFKPDRFISLYGLCGIGQINYTSKSFLGDVEYSAVSNTALIVPYGVGLKFRINKHFNMFVESNFRHTFVDDVDAYIGSGTDVNDIYSITSIGISYSFGAKKEKIPKLNDNPVEMIDTVIAEVKPLVKPIDLISNFPDSIESGVIYSIASVVDGDVVDDMTYTINIPKGMVISQVEGNYSTIQQNATNLIVKWYADSLSGQPAISYDMQVLDTLESQYLFSSSLEYKDGADYKMRFFKQQFISTTALEHKVVVTENSVDIVSNTAKDAMLFDYRIQVATVFGGTASKSLLRKRLNLDVNMEETPYKNSSRYTIGHYATYSQAILALKSVNVHGAYIVVFKDGEYQLYLSDINVDIMDKYQIGSGVIYKVQIAASKGRPYSIAKLAYKYGFKETDILEEKVGSWYFYTVGSAETFDHAKDLLRVIKNKKIDAYIIKYIDGVR